MSSENAERGENAAALLLTSAGVLALVMLIKYLVFAGFVAETNLTLVNVSGDQLLVQWERLSLHLLVTMPIGAALVVFTRTMLGLPTFGLFTPMLMSLAFLQTGPLLGPAVLGAALLAGVAFTPLLKKLSLSRVGFLGALVSLVVITLLLLREAIGGSLSVTVFPAVVSALMIERWWASRESDGLSKSLTTAANTIIVAVLIATLLVLAPIVDLAHDHPFAVAFVSFAAMIAMGRYRGLRVSELRRFRPVFEAEGGDLAQRIAAWRKRPLREHAVAARDWALALARDAAERGRALVQSLQARFAAQKEPT